MPSTALFAFCDSRIWILSMGKVRKNDRSTTSEFAKSSVVLFCYRISLLLPCLVDIAQKWKGKRGCGEEIEYELMYQYGYLSVLDVCIQITSQPVGARNFLQEGI